jgi:hypothetical protein
MMNDERDPRDDAAEPVTDRPTDDPTQPPGEDAPPTAAADAAQQAADEFEAPPPTTGEAEPAQAAAPTFEPEPTPEPERDATAEPAPATAWPEADQPPVASEPWPTEPPAAGSGDADAWPTRAPERDDEPAWEPAAHPPSEAEAYAAPPAADVQLDDTAAAAAVAATTPAHSVPAATEVGESTQCPRCGTENRPGLAFCRNCGQRLVAAGVAATVERPGTPEGTMACPRCGTHNRAGVAFCQNCGANLRAAATPGYVPPSAAVAEPAAVAPAAVAEGAGAVLGPVVLIIGALGVIAGWLLPFPYGETSLFDRAFGAGGYGAAFWNGYPTVTGGLSDQSYFGFAGPSPILAVLLVVLAIAGFMRARPGALQAIGLGLALIWAAGLAVLFVVVEVIGNLGVPLTELLRSLTPGGIIFFLASLIVLIGTLTRFARS